VIGNYWKLFCIAWSEVNLGSTPTWCATLEGSNLICLGTRYADEVGVYQITTLDNASITWFNLNSSWTYNITGDNNEILTITNWGNSSFSTNPCTQISALITVDQTTITKHFKICFQDCEGEGDPRSITSVEVAGQDIMFNVFPNPIENEFFIESSNEKSNTFSLSDIYGRELMNGIIDRGLNRFELDNVIQNGSYILKIKSETDNLDLIKKLIINR
jgi:hypothetical protein